MMNACSRTRTFSSFRARRRRPFVVLAGEPRAGRFRARYRHDRPALRRRVRPREWQPHARGTAVALLVAMADADLPREPCAGAIVHQFTVNRGMTVVLVLETTSWYSGLLQAALARITLEGQN